MDVSSFIANQLGLEDETFDKVTSVARTALPYVAIAATLVATRGASGGTLTKAGWTIYKRILGQNLLHAATSKEYDVGDAFKNSFSTTSWILEGITMSHVTEPITGPLINKLKYAAKSRATAGTGIALLDDVKSGLDLYKSKLATIYDDHLAGLARQEAGRAAHPTLDFATGEILPQRNMGMMLQDLGRKAQLSATGEEGLLRHFGKGATNQFVATNLFRETIGRPNLSKLAWSTKYVQGLDELYLPPGSARTLFTKSFMGLRAFDAATTEKTIYGTYSRRKRNNIFSDLMSTGRGQNSVKQLVNTYITPQRGAQLAGNIVMRKFLILAGEDKRIRRAYIRANSRGKDKQRSGNYNGSVHVSGHYRDGHWVKPYTRSVGDR